MGQTEQTLVSKYSVRVYESPACHRGLGYGREINYLLESFRQSAAKQGENLGIPSLQVDYLFLKHNFFFHVRLIPHLGVLSKKPPNTLSTIEWIPWEIKNNAMICYMGA